MGTLVKYGLGAVAALTTGAKAQTTTPNPTYSQEVPFNMYGNHVYTTANPLSSQVVPFNMYGNRVSTTANPLSSQVVPINLYENRVSTTATPLSSQIGTVPNSQVTVKPEPGPLPVQAMNIMNFNGTFLSNITLFTEWITKTPPDTVKKKLFEFAKQQMQTIYNLPFSNATVIGAHNSLTTSSKKIPATSIEIAGANQMLSLEEQLNNCKDTGICFFDFDIELQSDGSGLSYHAGKMGGRFIDNSKGAGDSGEILKYVSDFAKTNNVTVVIRNENNKGFGPSHLYDICKKAGCDMSVFDTFSSPSDTLESKRGKILFFMEHDIAGVEVEPDGTMKGYNVYSQSHTIIRLDWSKADEIIKAKTPEEAGALLLYNKTFFQNGGKALLLLDFYDTHLGADKKGLVKNIKQFFNLILNKLPLLKQYLKSKNIDTGEGAFYLVDGQTVENYVIMTILNILPMNDIKFKEIVLSVLQVVFVESSLKELVPFTSQPVLLDHYIPFVKNVEKMRETGKPQWSSNTQNTAIVTGTLSVLLLPLVYICYVIVTRCKQKGIPIPDSKPLKEAEKIYNDIYSSFLTIPVSLPKNYVRNIYPIDYTAYGVKNEH